MKIEPKKSNLLGIKWTYFPWPSFVIKALYRKFGPKPSILNPDDLASKTFKLSLLYAVGCMTFFSYVMYQVQTTRKSDLASAAKTPRDQLLDDGLYYASLTHEPKKSSKVILMRGVTKLEEVEMSDDVNKILYQRKKKFQDELLARSNEAKRES